MPKQFLRVLCALFTLLFGLTTAPASARDTTLRGGWTDYPPYSFLTTDRGISRWQGFDVELLEAISDRASTIVVSERVPWTDHIERFRTGQLDIAPHAVLTPERQEYAIFSIPYRTETMVLILRAEEARLAGAGNVDALIGDFRKHSFRMGVEESFELPSVPMRAFVREPGYDGAVAQLRTFDLVIALLNGEIDGFWADRVEAAYFLDTLGVSQLLTEHPVRLTGNLHFMFNKETVPWDVIYRFNAAIESVHADGTYQRLNTKYSFPILVSMSLDSFWFRAVDVLGTIAFALSGLLLAYRHNYDLFGALVLASLPAVGGGVVRDVISHREEIAFFSDPTYAYIILSLVGGGYLVQRLPHVLPDGLRERLTRSSTDRQKRILGGSIELCDAIGLAAFTVTGVVVALVTDSTPLLVWGPLLAAITAAGGGILRDITRSDPDIPFLKGELYPEIAVVWGLLLSGFLLWEATLLDPHHISTGIILTFFGVLITRLMVLWLTIRSPVFSGKRG